MSAFVRITDDEGGEYLINPYQVTHMRLMLNPGSNGTAKTYALILGTMPAMLHLRFRSAGARDKAIGRLAGEVPE